MNAVVPSVWKVNHIISYSELDLFNFGNWIFITGLVLISSEMEFFYPFPKSQRKN